MGFLTGSACGVLGVILANSFRKARLLSSPWEHAIAFALGGYAGIKYDEFYLKTRQELLSDLEHYGKAPGGAAINRNDPNAK